MGKLYIHQKMFEWSNIKIYEQITTTENSFIEENRKEIRTNTNKLKCWKDVLEKDQARIISERQQQLLQEEEEIKYIELEQKVRNTLADISATLLEARNY